MEGSSGGLQKLRYGYSGAVTDKNHWKFRSGWPVSRPSVDPHDSQVKVQRYLYANLFGLIILPIIFVHISRVVCCGKILVFDIIMAINMKSQSIVMWRREVW